MIYREAGEFKSTYAEDAQTFPIRLDRVWYWIVLAIACLLIPLTITEYMANAVLVPFLIWAIIAIGLNILTGYCGQVSLGTGGFMAVGAYAAYKIMTAFPDLNIFFVILLSGGITAGVGLLFGLPSLRIKGFYLAVATLAAQFFLVWLFNRVGWFYNYSASGQINAPDRTVFGFEVTGPIATAEAKYLFCLAFVLILAWAARNLTRGRLGRSWMAIRDMDIAAEIIGVNPLKAKLSAFAISSFYVGVGGALFFTVYLGAVEVGEAFGINKSFLALFMIIIGGLGSIFGSFAGAAFIVLMPVLLKNIMATDPAELGAVGSLFASIFLVLAALALVGAIVAAVHGAATKRENGGLVGGLVAMAVVLVLVRSIFAGGLGWPTDIAAHFEFVILGLLIITFLILEPHGLAALWRIVKEKLRLWPFPH